VDHRRGPLGELIRACRVQAEARAFQVRGPDAQPLVFRQPLRRGLVVVRAHQRVNVAIVTFE
jgi:hypothetical protein